MASPAVKGDTSDHVLVAAIDFGTTQSGFAFSTKSRPSDIVMNKNWGEEFGHAGYKCPTTVLTDDKGDFVSFGYAAENDYTVKLTEGIEGYQLYRHFKMILHQEKLTLKSKVVSTTGKSRTAIDIFIMALRYLKEEILKLLQQQQVKAISVSLIRWVITVPAIWKDEAKRFMREASFKAGLITEPESKKLIIALEPEAASMYCRGMELKLYHQGTEQDTEVHFQEGERYVIIDAGGGTADITCHEVQQNGKVKEIHPATGGAWGSIYVDKKFEDLMKNVLGRQFIENYQKTCPQDWFQFMLAFEQAKATFKPEEKRRVNIPITWSLGNEYQDTYEKDIDVGIKEKSRLGVDFDNGALVLMYATMNNLLRPVVSKTVDHVRDLLQKKELQSVKYILLVGGFGQCQLLKNEIKKVFGSDKSVLIPMEGQLAIIKGAVLFGHNPVNISTRIAKLTYGIGVMRPFDENLHKLEYQTMSYGRKMCNNIFDLVIKKGQDIDTESVVEFDLNANEKSRKDGYSVVSIYSTPKTGVLYTTEEQVTELASLKIEHKHDKKFAPIVVQFTVGGTELLMEAQDKETKEWVETTVDFLSDAK